MLYLLNELEVLQIEFATRISRDRNQKEMLCLLNVERIGNVSNFMSKKVVQQLCVSDEEL